MNFSKKYVFIAIILLLIVFVVFYFVLIKNTNEKVVAKIEYIHNQGKAQGTFYNATYLQPDGIDLQAKFENELHLFDLSLSTYDSTSIISRINRNEPDVELDSLFIHMYNVANQVSVKSNGAFDITVGPLVEAWGFGATNNDRTIVPNLKKLLPLVGYKKIKIQDNRIIKDLPGIFIDANAIAQGYSADIIAKLLERNGCENYMIEIGGEIVCKGLNPKGVKWKIGIDKPIDNPNGSNGEIQAIVEITNKALTTSGNYRKFYYKDGKKYAHTINPHTGYPVSHNLLSATVIAPTCIIADAYATAFMVLGVDSAMKLCKSIPQMDCYLIYSDEKGSNRVIYTDGFKKYLVEE